MPEPQVLHAVLRSLDKKAEPFPCMSCCRGDSHPCKEPSSRFWGAKKKAIEIRVQAGHIPKGTGLLNFV